MTPRVNQIVTGHRGQLPGFDGHDGWPGWDTVKAHMPEFEMASLVIELRSATAGLGTFTFSLDQMSELTGRAADQVVQSRKGRGGLKMRVGGRAFGSAACLSEGSVS